MIRKAVKFLSTALLCGVISFTSNLSLSQSQPMPDVELVKKVSDIPKNPKHGDVIWGNLTVGMKVDEVLAAIPGAVFDDQWSSAGMVGIMAESGIVASNKIKVTAPITGPFQSKSTLYVLFDEADRLDGIVIMTKKSELPEKVLANYGAIGFYLAEYKDAAKMIIRYAIPELGKRTGPPRFGKESMDSLGGVGVAKSMGSNKALGMGINFGSISPASIVQAYSREGYKSMLSIRSAYLGTYGVYSGIFVFMSIQAKAADDDIEDIE